MTAGDITSSFFKYASRPVAVVVGLYAILLGLLTMSTFQSHVVYLHAIQMTWFKDLNVPGNLWISEESGHSVLHQNGGR
jgi:hypothetical protein